MRFNNTLANAIASYGIGDSLDAGNLYPLYTEGVYPNKKRNVERDNTESGSTDTLASTLSSTSISHHAALATRYDATLLSSDMGQVKINTENF